MKKRSIRICLILALCILLYLSFSTAAFAEEIDEGGAKNAAVDGESTTEEVENPDNGSEIGANDEVKAEESTNDEAPKNNPFEEVAALIYEHTAELLSALTLIGSVILAYAYKKGLIPLISRALEKLSGNVSKIGESAQNTELLGQKIKEELSKTLEGIEESILAIKERIENTENALVQKECALKESLKFTEVLYAQVDMMYELFASSSLPEYKKEEVGRRILGMKKTVEGIENALYTDCAITSNDAKELAE